MVAVLGPSFATAEGFTIHTYKANMPIQSQMRVSRGLVDNHPRPALES